MTVTHEHKVNILLVDDNPANLLALTAVLTGFNYHLVTALSGEEALKLFDQQEFAIVILDIQMPGLDGYQTARRIKEHERGKDIPIIFVTAIYKDDPFVKQGFEAGAIDYFGKPFDPEILRAKVGIYAGLYQKTHKLREREIELIKTQELLKAERKLKTILETLSEGVMIADKSGKITECNAEAMRIWGADRPVAACDLQDYVGWRTDSGVKLGAQDWGMARALASGDVCQKEEIRIQCFDGSQKIISNSASPLRDESGEIVGAVAVIEDITDKCQVETDLVEKIKEFTKAGLKTAPLSDFS